MSYSLAREADWISLTWQQPQAIEALVPYFRLATGRTFPASVSVEYWDGRHFVPVTHASVTMATESDQASRVTFDRVSTMVRLVVTSAAPGTPDAFVQVSELEALGDLAHE